MDEALEGEFVEYAAQPSTSRGYAKRGFSSGRSRGRGRTQPYQRDRSRQNYDSEQNDPQEPPTRRNFSSFRASPRARFTKRDRPNLAVAHIKSKDPTSSGIAMYPRTKSFIVDVGNTGITRLASTFYNALVLRDSKIGHVTSALQLEYILSISYTHRIVQTAIMHGYAGLWPAVSQLKQAAANIQLPGMLAKYIECIGVYQMATGVMVAPFAGDYHELYPPGPISRQVSPESILNRADRPIPQNNWRIDIEWINDWNAATTRMYRTGVGLASVSTEYEGRAEMIVSYKLTDDNISTILGVSPQKLTEAEGKLGACYSFRDYNHQATWLPGPENQVLYSTFNTTEFNPEVYLTDLFVANLAAITQK